MESAGNSRRDRAAKAPNMEAFHQRKQVASKGSFPCPFPMPRRPALTEIPSALSA